MACDTYHPVIKAVHRAEIVVRTYHPSDIHKARIKAEEAGNNNHCDTIPKVTEPFNYDRAWMMVRFESDDLKDVTDAALEFLAWCRFSDDVTVESC